VKNKSHGAEEWGKAAFGFPNWERRKSTLSKGSCRSLKDKTKNHQQQLKKRQADIEGETD